MSSDSKVCIVASAVGLVIGNLFDLSGGKIVLNKPRILQSQPIKDGGLALSLLVPLGAPSSAVLKDDCWWEVEDAEMKKKYLEAITGLTLVQNIPKGGKLQ